MSLGVTLAAPAVVMSTILGWTLPVTILAICVPMIIYTITRGVQAVAWTDVKQMFIVVGGMSIAAAILLYGIVQHVSFGQALHLAGATGRLNAVDFRFDISETYTFWSGMIGGLFLMLSYFGCDQSQVQRYLTAKSIDEARQSLMMSAYVKIPLQLLILTCGVLVFVFYLFQTPPMLFKLRLPDAQGLAASNACGGEFSAASEVVRRRDCLIRRDAATRDDGDGISCRNDRRVKTIRSRAADLVRQTTGDSRYDDVNYVFPTFITTHMPIGLVGLMIAAIFAAAMSASGGELNALATATIIDFYRRHFVTHASDAHYLMASSWPTHVLGARETCGWLRYRCQSRVSLIEVVNRYGSFFYGSLLGVFILGILTTRATSAGAFWGLSSGMIVVLTVAFTCPWIAFLWHNLIGAVVVVAVGMAISFVGPRADLKHSAVADTPEKSRLNSARV